MSNYMIKVVDSEGYNLWIAADDVVRVGEGDGINAPKTGAIVVFKYGKFAYTRTSAAEIAEKIDEYYNQ